jgi:hypothetical protein
VKIVRALSRFVFLTTVAVLILDALLLVVALNPTIATTLPAIPDITDSDPKDLWPLAGWLIGFWLFLWLVTRDRHYSTEKTPGRRASSTSAYARAIPPHEDLVDLLAGVPGAGAREVAADLLKGPHETPDKRKEAEKEAAKWIMGAEAEERAARLLKALGPDWTVLHDITVHHRGWNIDHVAIGPQGVFVINTKTTSAPTIVADGDRLVIHGWHTDYITKSRKEAYRTSMALFGRDQQVTPVLLFVNTPPVDFRSPPGDVWIAEAHNVIDALTDGPVSLSPKQYGRLVAKARYQQTWIDGWERAQAASRRRRTSPRV